MRRLPRSCLLTVVLLAARASAQEPPPPPPDPPPPPPPSRPHQGRELNGHHFIPSNIAADPFTSTYFGSQTGFGYLGVTVPERDGQGKPTGTSHAISLTPFTQSFGLQIGILPKYWALRAAVTGLAIAPVTGQTALEFGGQFGWDVDVGTTLSFRLGRYVRLGALFDFDYSSNYSFDIASTLTRSLVAGHIDASTLLANSTTAEVRGGLAFAVAPHRSLGLTLAAQYIHDFLSGDRVASSDSGSISFTTALDLDLHAVSPVPIGIIGAYSLNAPTSDTSQITHQVGGGIYYTGRRSLVLGPEVRAILPPGSLSETFVYGVITLRYYW